MVQLRKDVPELHISLATGSSETFSDDRRNPFADTKAEKAGTESIASLPYAQPATSDEQPPLRPTLRLMLSLSTRRELILYPAPALALSLFCGLLPPYITTVLGDAFNVFAVYVAVQTQTSSPTALAPARARLLGDMLTVMIKLLVLAAITLIANIAALTLWSCFGETVSRHLRRHVYLGVSGMPLEWFDTGMGKKRRDATEEEEATGEGEGPGGEASGGLTGRFSRRAPRKRNKPALI
jgi:ATP-binding cassette subfamily B (MDR/TAP) protein 1